MSGPSFAAAPFAVRRDIEEAHQRAWARLAAPGTWWSGAERVAIARATRNSKSCRLCAERKAAVSPFAVEGSHDHDPALPDAIVDVAHRVTTDPGRLSRKWFDAIRATGIDDAHYVEALGVTVRTVAIDTFCSAIGARLHPLPDPIAGEPSRVRPDNVVDEGFWVPVQPQGAKLYDGRMMPNVGRALSLVPDEAHGVLDIMPSHYVAIDRVADAAHDPGRAIDRAQMELIAGRVSALNECFY
jgi:hypothetical protein